MTDNMNVSARSSMMAQKFNQVRDDNTIARLNEYKEMEKELIKYNKIQSRKLNKNTIVVSSAKEYEVYQAIAK